MQSGEQHNELCFGAGDDEGCWPDTSMSGRGAAARAGCSGGGGGGFGWIGGNLELLQAGLGDGAPSGGRLSQGLPRPLHPLPPLPVAAGQRVCRAGPSPGPLPRWACRRRARGSGSGPLPQRASPRRRGQSGCGQQPRVNMLLDTQLLDTQNRAMQTCQHSTAKCHNPCIGRFKPMYQIME